MDYEIKSKTLSILSEMRNDLDRSAELVQDGNAPAAVNLFRDLERDFSALQSIFRLDKRHSGGKVPDPRPCGLCVDLKTPAAVDLQSDRAAGL